MLMRVIRMSIFPLVVDDAFCFQEFPDFSFCPVRKRVIAKGILKNFLVVKSFLVKVDSDEILFEAALRLPASHHSVEDELGFKRNCWNDEAAADFDLFDLGSFEMILVASAEGLDTELRNHIQINAIDFELTEVVVIEVAISGWSKFGVFFFTNALEELIRLFCIFRSNQNIEVVEIVLNSEKEEGRRTCKCPLDVIGFKKLRKLSENRPSVSILLVFQERLDVCLFLGLVVMHHGHFRYTSFLYLTSTLF